MTKAALFDTFARIPLRFERGEGVWLVTEDGERYLDFGSGIAVNSLGHCHPVLVERLTSQAAKLWHTSNYYEVPGQEMLSRRLVENSFADKVFFTNSGAEAVECAIKTARRYHYAKGNAGRFRIITFEGAFHGRTLGTIAAGGQAKYLEGFGPKVSGFDQIPLADLDILQATITDKTAAILIEPILGEGGVQKVPSDYLQNVRRLCDESGVLLIVDEVQTGIGRTGEMFAYQRSGVTPDIMALAKGIGGGYPLGACLATETAAAGMTVGTHGTTFGGNQLGMAVGNAVLDVVLADGFLENVRTVSLVLHRGLANLARRFPNIIRDVRGEGLMIGVKANVPVSDLVNAMREQWLLGVPAGDNVVRLLPALTLTVEEAHEGLVRLEKAVARLAAAGTTPLE